MAYDYKFVWIKDGETTEAQVRYYEMAGSTRVSVVETQTVNHGSLKTFLELDAYYDNAAANYGAASVLLKEDGDALLLETGDQLLL
jgi:hypothetical protein